MRAGNARWNVTWKSASRRRAVRSWGRTRSRDTDRGVHPRSRPITGPSRALRSTPASVAWMSGTTDLTSTDQQVASGRVPGKDVDRAPLAPTWNVTSGSASHPASRNRASMTSTRRAWSRSSSRSSSSPCHWSLIDSRAPEGVGHGLERPYREPIGLSRARSGTRRTARSGPARRDRPGSSPAVAGAPEAGRRGARPSTAEACSPPDLLGLTRGCVTVAWRSCPRDLPVAAAPPCHRDRTGRGHGELAGAAAGPSAERWPRCPWR